MDKLIPPKTIILSKGLKPKKSFGQNFMTDQIINSIFAATASSFGKGLSIIEIGAGTGSLTSHLLKISPSVHAIERDRDLIPILKEQFFSELTKIHLVLHEADGARFDLSTILSSDRPGVLVGNLPYHLTSSILLLALKYRSSLKGAVFLVQKEVADRLVAKPNNKQYGFLPALLGLCFEIKKIREVEKTAFWPIPKVDSAIIKMTALEHGLPQAFDLEGLTIFIREIFQKRRKKLSTILAKKISKDRFEGLGIDPNLRPENLEPSQFLAMFLA